MLPNKHGEQGKEEKRTKKGKVLANKWKLIEKGNHTLSQIISLKPPTSAPFHRWHISWHCIVGRWETAAKHITAAACIHLILRENGDFVLETSRLWLTIVHSSHIIYDAISCWHLMKVGVFGQMAAVESAASGVLTHHRIAAGLRRRVGQGQKQGTTQLHCRVTKQARRALPKAIAFHRRRETGCTSA